MCFDNGEFSTPLAPLTSLAPPSNGLKNLQCAVPVLKAFSQLIVGQSHLLQVLVYPRTCMRHYRTLASMGICPEDVHRNLCEFQTTLKKNINILEFYK